MGYGLGTCATCDGALYRGKQVAVVGGGDTAVEEATLPDPVRQQGHADPPPRHAPRLEDHAGPALRQPEDRLRLERRGRRLPRRDASPIRFLTGVRLRSTKDGSTRDVPFDGVFLAIGHSPNTDVFKGQLAMTPEGYLLTRTALAWDGVEAPRACSTRTAQLRHGHERRGRLRRRRRRRHPLPPGDHRRRLGLRRGDRLREVARSWSSRRIESTSRRGARRRCQGPFACVRPSADFSGGFGLQCQLPTSLRSRRIRAARAARPGRDPDGN